MFRHLVFFLVVFVATPSFAQTGNAQIRGRVTDETGGVLPGVTVELRAANTQPKLTVTGADGEFLFENVAPGTYQLSFTLINFGSVTHRDLKIQPAALVRNDEVMHL